MKKLIFLFGLLLTFGLGKAQMQDPVHWKFSMTDVSKTEKELQFTAKIDDHWHVYGLHIPEDGPNPTTFTFTSVEGAELVGEVTSPSKLITKYDETFGMELNWYEKEVTFIQRIKLTGENFTVKGYLRYMTCDDQSCLPPTSEEFEFTGKGLSAADLAATAAKAAPKKEVKKESAKPAEKKNNEPKQNVAQPAEKTAETAKPTSNEVTTATTPTAQTTTTDLWTPVIDKLQARGETTTTTDTSLWFLFFSGFVGGLLALLTPCVWPMIPMTVSFFLKRSNNRNRSIRDAIIYGLAIIIIYVGLGLLITAIFGASALNSLATNAVFNILFFALLVVFAISFFGAFELTLPASWTTKLDSKADSTSGLLSIFFMAFTLALVSFSCTGPIIGTLLVQAASMGVAIGPAIGMFGFALGSRHTFCRIRHFPLDAAIIAALGRLAQLGKSGSRIPRTGFRPQIPLGSRPCIRLAYPRPRSIRRIVDYHLCLTGYLSVGKTSFLPRQRKPACLCSPSFLGDDFIGFRPLHGSRIVGSSVESHQRFCPAIVDTRFQPL